MTPYSFPLTTAATAAALGILQTGLMMFVAIGRGKTSTGLGDGGDAGLLQRIRMHGNLAENAPLFLILLGLVEMSGAWAHWVPYLALIFIVARIAHPIGLYQSSGTSIPRAIGAMGTMAATLCACTLLAITAIHQFGLRG